MTLEEFTPLFERLWEFHRQGAPPPGTAREFARALREFDAEDVDKAIRDSIDNGKHGGLPKVSEVRAAAASHQKARRAYYGPQSYALEDIPADTPRNRDWTRLHAAIKTERPDEETVATWVRALHEKYGITDIHWTGDDLGDFQSWCRQEKESRRQAALARLTHKEG